MPHWFIYILKSQKDNKHYIGYTGDLQRRLAEHFAGKTKSLRKRLPVKLVYTEQYNTKQEAQKREKEIKSYKGGEAFKNLLHKNGTVPEWSNG